VRDRWNSTAAISLPLLTITAYLFWLWPRPRGTSVLAEVGPYVVSLLTGLPFAWRLARSRAARWWLLFAFLVGGFVVLWVYAAAVLCGVRGVCL
jgi:RsiW-degrading membrane proteinase PrsW (M82 family)